MTISKGPWTAVRNTAYWQINDVNNRQIGDVCASKHLGVPQGEVNEALEEANARAISALPDMVAVLRLIATLSTDDTMVTAAKAALAKAGVER